MKTRSIALIIFSLTFVSNAFLPNSPKIFNTDEQCPVLQIVKSATDKLEVSSQNLNVCYEDTNKSAHIIVKFVEQTVKLIKDRSNISDFIEVIGDLLKSNKAVVEWLKVCYNGIEDTFDILHKRAVDNYNSKSHFLVRLIREATVQVKIQNNVQKLIDRKEWTEIGTYVARIVEKVLVETEYESLN